MKIWSYKDKKTKRFVIVGQGGEKVLEFCLKEFGNNCNNCGANGVKKVKREPNRNPENPKNLKLNPKNAKLTKQIFLSQKL